MQSIDKNNYHQTPSVHWSNWSAKNQLFQDLTEKQRALFQNNGILEQIWGEPDFTVMVFGDGNVGVWVIYFEDETILVQAVSTASSSSIEIRMVVPAGVIGYAALKYCAKNFPYESQDRFLNWLVDELEAGSCNL